MNKLTSSIKLIKLISVIFSGIKLIPLLQRIDNHKRCIRYELQGR